MSAQVLCVDFGTSNSAAAVLELFHRWRSGEAETRPEASFLARFERGRLTERLAGVFEDALAAQPAKRSLSEPQATRTQRAA